METLGRPFSGCVVRLALLGFGSLLGLLAAEASVRLLEPDLRDVVEARFDRHQYRIHANPRDFKAMRRHPDTGRRHPVIFNSLGMRQHRQFSVEKPPGTLRVGFFGDSFTANLRLPVQDSFTEPLEFLLRRSGTDAEVMNFGTDGYGTDQSWLQYEDEAPVLGLDLVYYVFCHNDLRDLLANELFELSSEGAVRYRPQRRQRLWVDVARRFHLTYFVARRSAQLRARLEPSPWEESTVLDAEREKKNRRRLAKVLVAGSSAEKENALELFRVLMRRFEAATAKRGQLFRVVLLPRRGEANRAVASILDELGIKTVDLFQYFYPDLGSAAALRTEYFFRTDGHWNAAGNRRASSVLLPLILAELGRHSPSDDEVGRWLRTYDSAFADADGELLGSELQGINAKYLALERGPAVLESP